ncbi:MAG: FHA domain-containing protein [Chloroflexota bacterium]
MQQQYIAKIIWEDQATNQQHEHVLAEGATATIGRATTNDIFVLDRHVSRQHAVIIYRDGVFMIRDLGSINGTFVNDERIREPFPLFSGDIIRLYIPILRFEAATIAEMERARDTGNLSTATLHTGRGRLVITNGEQEGQVIPLILDTITIGRATSNPTWDVSLRDPAISRPHARMMRDDKGWSIYDMESANGTRVNDQPVNGVLGQRLNDGDIIIMGNTLLLFLEE